MDRTLYFPTARCDSEQSICLTKTTYVDDDDIKSVFWPTTANPWTMWRGQIGLYPFLKIGPLLQYNEIFIVDDSGLGRLLRSLKSIIENKNSLAAKSPTIWQTREREELIKSQNNLIMNSVLSIITEWLVSDSQWWFNNAIESFCFVLIGTFYWFSE